MPEGNIGIVEREKRARAVKKLAAKQAAKERARARKVAPVRPSADAAQPTTRKERRQIATQQRIGTKRAAAVKKLEGAGMHRQAKQLRAGAPITKDFASRIGADFESAAYGFLPGVYQVGKAVTQDVSDIGHGRVGRRQGHKPFAHTGGVAEQIGKQYAHDYRHPLRHLREHPGFFALDAAALASAGAGTAARAGLVTSALREGGGLSAALKAGAKKPVPEIRMHSYRGAQVRGRYSTNPAAKAVQKRSDRAGRDISTRKFESLTAQQRRIEKAAANAPALRAQSVATPKFRSDLMAKFGKHHSGTVEEAAVRVVMEGAPLDDVIDFHKAQAASAERSLRHKRRGGVPGSKTYSPQQTMRLSDHRRKFLKQAAIFEEARKYLDVDAAGEPIISAAHPELAEKYGITLKAAQTRTARAQRHGLLSYEAAERRKNAPGAIMTGPARSPRPIYEDRPRTLGEAQGRVAELQATVDKAEQGVAKMLMARNPDKYPGHGAYIGARPSDIAKGRPSRQVSEIEKGSYRSGYRRRVQDPTKVGDVVEAAGQGRLTAKPKTGAELALEDAQKWLAEKAAASDHPSLKAYRDAERELSELKGKVEKATEPEFMREPVEASRGVATPSATEYERTQRKIKDWPDVMEVYLRGEPDPARPQTYSLTPIEGGEAYQVPKHRVLGATEKEVVIGKAPTRRTFEASSSAERQVPEFETQLRTVRERKGEPGISIEDAYYAGIKQSDPNAKMVVKRDASGEPVGILHIYLDESGNPELLSVVVKEEARRQGIASELYRAAESAGLDIRPAMGKGGYTAEGARFANRFEQTRPAAPPVTGDFGSVSEFRGMTPQQDFAAGKERVPDVIGRYPPPTHVAEVRGGIERADPAFKHTYTGAHLKGGTRTMHPIRAVAESALRLENWIDRNRFRKTLVQVGSKERPPNKPRFMYHGRMVGGTQYVPVKVRELSRSEGRDLNRLLEQTELENLTPTEAARIEESLAKYEREMFPDPADYANVRVGEDTSRGVNGVVWVDKRLMKSQKKIIGRIPVVDEISDIVKGLILYGKPGYVAPNVIGNIIYNIFQQGFLAAGNFSRAVRLPRDLDFMVKEMMGSGYSRSLAEGTMSPASFAVHKAADFWSTFVDDPFRKSAFIHEARRGARDIDGRLHKFRSDDELRSLIMDAHHEGVRGEITQRARDAIIDYERMGPVERDLVRRMLFIYPWVKGSTYYAGQFFRDHPIQAAVYARIGQMGEAKNLEELGPVPAWARGGVKVGGTEAEPRVAMTSTISPFTTPVGAIRMFSGGGERSEQLIEATNPVFQAGVEAAAGRELFSGKELRKKGALGLPGEVYAERFGAQIGKGLPQYNLYKRGGLNFIPGVDQHVKEGATYPYSPSDARKQFTAGSWYPRPVNLAKLNEQAASPSATKLDKLKAERAAVVPKLPKEFTPEDKAYVKRAYKIATDIETIRDQVQEDKGEGEPYFRAVLEAEAKYLHGRGIFDDEDLKWLTKLARTGSYDEVRKRRNALVQGPYEDIYLTAKRNARKAVGYESP